MNFLEVVKLLQLNKNFARRKIWLINPVYKPVIDKIYINNDNNIACEYDDYGLIQIEYRGEFLSIKDILAEDWEIVKEKP